jgi:hypothetical protein
MQSTIMAKHTTSYDEAFLTGCDSSQEWMLTWFLKNYKKNSTKPLVFANFGVTDACLDIMRANCHAIMDMTNTEEKGWFKKPLSMIKCPAHKTVWIDTDCEIRMNIDGIFDLLQPNILNMSNIGNSGMSFITTASCSNMTIGSPKSIHFSHKQ